MSSNLTLVICQGAHLGSIMGQNLTPQPYKSTSLIIPMGCSSHSGLQTPPEHQPAIRCASPIAQVEAALAHGSRYHHCNHRRTMDIQAGLMGTFGGWRVGLKSPTKLSFNKHHRLEVIHKSLVQESQFSMQFCGLLTESLLSLFGCYQLPAKKKKKPSTEHILKLFHKMYSISLRGQQIEYRSTNLTTKG